MNVAVARNRGMASSPFSFVKHGAVCPMLKEIRKEALGRKIICKRVCMYSGFIKESVAKDKNSSVKMNKEKLSKAVVCL